MVNLQANVASLRSITELPVDIDDPFYHHYPSLKLGINDSIRHYAHLLAPLAAKVIETHAAYNHWVITSPAMNMIPSAANLLCWRIYDLLREKFVKSIQLELINIHEQDRFADAKTNTETEKKSIYRSDYSQLKLSDRIKSRQRSNRFIIDDYRFRNKSILFVNDINVTGTQQTFLQKYFDRLHTTLVHWLYIIDVERGIGQCEPQLESKINYSKYADFEEFAFIVSTVDIQYTSKCIWRLFSYSMEELDYLFQQLDASRKLRILNLVLSESYFQLGEARKKVELLQTHCQKDDKHNQ